MTILPQIENTSKAREIIKIIKRDPVEVLELKFTVTEMTNSLEGRLVDLNLRRKKP